MRWVAEGAELAAARSDLPPQHDRDVCRTLDDPPRRYCGPVVRIEDVRRRRGGADIVWSEQNYCSTTSGSLGWNVVLTLEESRLVVVARRSSGTRLGGWWSVSANETAEPGDLPSAAATSPVDLDAAAGRTLKEELGLEIDGGEGVRHLGIFTSRGSYGHLTHVDGDRYGLSPDDVTAAWEGAEGAWEGEPEVQPVRNVLEDTGRRWTPWARWCIARCTER